MMIFLKHRIFPIGCFLFLLVGSAYGSGQNSKCKTWKTLSCPEKKWVMLHPFIAGKAYRYSEDARKETDTLKNDTTLDGDADGGQLDAFRHAYWMALLSQDIKPKKALKLGKAHERGNYKDFLKGREEEGSLTDSVASAMDLWNNQTGSEVGFQYHNLSAEELKIKIIEAIKSGRMKIIYKNSQGVPLTCTGEIIDLNIYYQKWNVPKCMVHSNSLRK